LLSIEGAVEVAVLRSIRWDCCVVSVKYTKVPLPEKLSKGTFVSDQLRELLDPFCVQEYAILFVFDENMVYPPIFQVIANSHAGGAVALGDFLFEL
jgi:hypothetical protein